jgi:hypothetical protein
MYLTTELGKLMRQHEPMQRYPMADFIRNNFAKFLKPKGRLIDIFNSNNDVKYNVLERKWPTYLSVNKYYPLTATDIRSIKPGHAVIKPKSIPKTAPSRSPVLDSEMIKQERANARYTIDIAKLHRNKLPI